VFTPFRSSLSRSRGALRWRAFSALLRRPLPCAQERARKQARHDGQGGSRLWKHLRAPLPIAPDASSYREAPSPISLPVEYRAQPSSPASRNRQRHAEEACVRYVPANGTNSVAPCCSPLRGKRPRRSQWPQPQQRTCLPRDGPAWGRGRAQPSSPASRDCQRHAEEACVRYVPPNGTNSVAPRCSLLTTRGAAEAKPMAAAATENLSSEERSCVGVRAGRGLGGKAILSPVPEGTSAGGLARSPRRVSPRARPLRDRRQVQPARRVSAPPSPPRPAPAGCGRQPVQDGECAPTSLRDRAGSFSRASPQASEEG